jgi:hypothetical protein
MIREVAPRFNRGAPSMLLMGVALGVAEEFVKQTSLAPLPWVDSSGVYGRVAGINLLWLLGILGFESVWVVLMPIQLTEVMFLATQRATLAQNPRLVCVSTSVRDGLLHCLVWLDPSGAPHAIPRANLSASTGAAGCNRRDCPADHLCSIHSDTIQRFGAPGRGPSRLRFPCSA